MCKVCGNEEDTHTMKKKEMPDFSVKLLLKHLKSNHDDTEETSSKLSRSSNEKIVTSRTSFEDDVTVSTYSETIRSRKRVRFAASASCDAEVDIEVLDTIKPSSLMTESEIQSLYWNDSDYEFFRGTAFMIAHEIRKIASTSPPQSHSYDSVLSNVYQRCQRIHKQSSTLLVSNSTSQIIPPNLFDAFVKWTISGHSRRGLEKHCVSVHIQERCRVRQDLVDAIISVQSLLTIREQNKHSKHDKQLKKLLRTYGIYDCLNSLKDDDILKIVSERFSRTSVLYASVVGQADAAAICHLQSNYR
jgi:hypothetical protein